jgi:hypothetical protein
MSRNISIHEEAVSIVHPYIPCFPMNYGYIC